MLRVFHDFVSCLGFRAKLEHYARLRYGSLGPVASRYNQVLMIAHLRGKLLVKHPNQAIVEVGGVGYDVTITVPTFSDLPGAGSEVALHVHTHVREDTIALYADRGEITVREAADSERDWPKTGDHDSKRDGCR